VINLVPWFESRGTWYVVWSNFGPKILKKKIIDSIIIAAEKNANLEKRNRVFSTNADLELYRLEEMTMSDLN